MLLGGLRYLIPVIKVAQELGLHVITCDYLPDNIAHKYSDEYHNVSIVDKEAVLKLAQELQIDGIMSFAVDPGVVTASYVQEHMGLPSFGPYESVCILQDKARFREFLRNHGFNCPWSYGFNSVEIAIEQAQKFSYPAIVKPTDAAGSKGVSRVDGANELLPALKHAMSCSLSGHIIVEEFLDKQGCSSDSDCFLVDGKFEFISFSAQRFDTDAINPYTPAAYSWPSTMGENNQLELSQELQRLVALLGMKNGIFNIETRVAANGKAYIMEVTPRGGGNRLAELLQYSTGVPLIENAVRACVGFPLIDFKKWSHNDYWLEIILHARKDGVFREIYIPTNYKDQLMERDLWVCPGEKVKAFRGANDAVGTLIFKLDTIDSVGDIMKQMKDFVVVNPTEMEIK